MNDHPIPNLTATLLFTLLMAASAPVAEGQEASRRVSFRNRSTDLVILKGGQRLYGIVMPGDETQILVRRQWVTSAADEFFRTDVEPQLTLQQERHGTPLAKALREEIDRRESEEPKNIEYVGILKETMNRVVDDSRPSSPWLLLTVPRDRIQRIQTQVPKARTIGFLAILNQIDGAETRSWQDISRQLAALPEAVRVSSLPEPQPPADQNEQLLPILSSIDLRLGKSKDYIQIGSEFIADDETVSVESLLPLLLSGTVQQQLQELLSAGGASAGVTRNSLLNLPPLAAPGNAVWKQLEDQGIQTIRISAFGIDLNSGRATVRVAVYRHNDSGPARLITQAMQSVESREITAEQAQEIGDDARVEQIATLFSSLGSSQSDLTQALRIGAAMQSAMANAEAQLQIQLDHILQGRPPGQTATPPDRVTLTSPKVQ